MRSLVTCPSCGRFINLENVETYCRLCGADMCSRCMHTCQECGKEVCRDCWSGGNMCIRCSRKSGFFGGIEKLGSDSTIDKVAGVVGITTNAIQYLSDKEKLQKQSNQRAKEREEARKRIMGQQRKQLRGN